MQAHTHKHPVLVSLRIQPLLAILYLTASAPSRSRPPDSTPYWRTPPPPRRTQNWTELLVVQCSTTPLLKLFACGSLSFFRAPRWATNPSEAMRRRAASSTMKTKSGVIRAARGCSCSASSSSTHDRRRSGVCVNAIRVKNGRGGGGCRVRALQTDKMGAADGNDDDEDGGSSSSLQCRRRQLMLAVPSVAAVLLPHVSARAEDASTAAPSTARGDEYEFMPAYGNGKKRTLYPDFTLSSTGLQYKDLVVGNGEKLVGEGSRVTIDWAGYTIGYYGRIFETRNRSKGGSFTGAEIKDTQRNIRSTYLYGSTWRWSARIMRFVF